MSYQCTIEERAAQPTLSIRTRTSVQDLPRVMGESYGAIGQYLGMSGAAPAGAAFTAYYNMDMQDMDVEIGFPVATLLPGKDNIQAGEIPAGKYATTIHTGPYSDLAQAYEPLTQFVQEQGLEPTGIAYEFYLNDPTTTPPEQLQTQVAFLLKSG